jgi:hypothetical protein
MWSWVVAEESWIDPYNHCLLQLIKHHFCSIKHTHKDTSPCLFISTETHSAPHPLWVARCHKKPRDWERDRNGERGRLSERGRDLGERPKKRENRWLREKAKSGRRPKNPCVTGGWCYRHCGAEASMFSGCVVIGDQFLVKIYSNFPVSEVDVF